MARTCFVDRGAAWRRRLLPLVTLLALTSDAAAADDLVLRTRVAASDRGEPSEITHYWTAKHLVEDLPQARILADLEAHTIVVIDKQAKTYSIWSFDEFRRTGADAARKLADTRERLARMAPSQRRGVPAMVRAMMALGPPGPDGTTVWSVTPTGARKRIAGREADEFSISAGTVEGSVWAAPRLRPPFSATDLAAFRAAATGSPRFGLNPLDRIDGVDGVLLRTRTILPGADGLSVTMEVTEIRAEAPPAEMLQIPAGFTRVQPQTPAPAPPPGAPM